MGAWVHLFCAMWTPGVRIEDIRQMTDIRLPPSVKRGINAFQSVCLLQEIGWSARFVAPTMVALWEYQPILRLVCWLRDDCKVDTPERDPVGDATKFY